MENNNVKYDEATENLKECNLKKVQLEASRLGVNNCEKLNKEQIIEKILERSILHYIFVCLGHNQKRYTKTLS